MSHEVEILLVEDSPEDAELTIRTLRRNKLANAVQIAEFVLNLGQPAIHSQYA